ncbi:hypothetical protein Hanom_Chr16g01491261 [Helianthus anomalus]
MQRISLAEPPFSGNQTFKSYLSNPIISSHSIRPNFRSSFVVQSTGKMLFFNRLSRQAYAGSELFLPI